ncbi:bifunctional (p)ppGpp synthetase/guanosine-3',5'-bis(diphosphate) 3'-pyrophosphohydrolase [Acetobacteraceae bacterium]|nr:bifunctional (p)ppGpp synthetase/guanosine-3',5'-bis(diphosphate) 3'-pyrophosphohydrolase [Candidatus Parcubacteria bacterium]
MEGLKEILDQMSGASGEDRALVEKAYVFASQAHKGHKRLSGEPYLVHLVETAKGLAALGMGSKTVAAGLLHDSIEDVGILPDTLEKEFGKEVRFLVEGVTKLGHFKYHGAERHRESLRKLLVATGQDARVLIIKLMDRLHNMRTLRWVPEVKRHRIAMETLEIYAAIAHRLGMGLVRKELEDLAFEYGYPEEFKETKTLLHEKAKETRSRLEHMTRTLRKELAKNEVTKFETDYRVKGFYSLWQKLMRKDRDMSKVYDIAAIRIVVPTVADCYRVLGIVNNLWQPLPNKIKDYIAFPKPNGYQSLHTTVFAGDGGIVEVQIRTKEMHDKAQYGIAAHVIYKEKGGKTPGGRATSFDWIRSLIPGFGGRAPVPKLSEQEKKRSRYGAPSAPEWLANLDEEEVDDPDFETTLRTDIFTHRVFVFTPHGDVVDLPLEATPIDFAYAIHSDIGDHVAGVKVNGKMVQLDTVLENGDIVEIETRKGAYPKRKWLDIAQTTLARRHIRNALERENK